MRYPADLTVTAGDFDTSGWREILDSADREGYSGMWSAFSKAAREAMDAGDLSRGKVLWLLADACSMMLVPNSPNEPFKPIAVFHDRRSVIPDDLSDADFVFFNDILDGVDDSWLRARLADLLWLKLRPRKREHALAAIDAYRSIPLDQETWLRGGQQCWERAMSLGRMLGKGSGERWREIEERILAALDEARPDEGYFALWLAEFLMSHRLGRERCPDVASKLETMGRDFETAGDLQRARDYFRVSTEFYKSAGSGAKAAELTAAHAEAWFKEAIAQASGNPPSHMVAATFFENAIQVYRTIPRKERHAWRVDERIAELQRHLNEAGEKSLDELGVMSTPGVDIGELVDNARKSVSGKAATDALYAFVNLHHGVDVKEMRERALERLRQFPLQGLFSATILSQDGRVIAKRPGLSLGGEPTDDDEVVIRSEMIRDYGILVGLIVQGDVWPALEVLLLEHRLREGDFVGLAHQSPIVPQGRESLFAKALFAGYERDFVTALHLLVPQIEHMVRVHLKQAGARTTTLGLDGVEHENGLSTLMDLPEAVKVFGENLCFELRSLYCDPFGPNLRNELAHGLLDENACQSIYAIYAWWLALKLVFNTFWNAGRSTDNSATGEGDDA